jgi:flagellar biosynthetic protein FlhB
MADYQDKEQKTEEATPRRRQEAREKGQVALSTEFIAAAGLVAGFLALALGGGRLARELGALVVDVCAGLPRLGTAEWSTLDAAGLVEAAFLSVAGALALVVGPTMLAVSLAGYGQVGFQVSPQAVEPRPERLDPLQGFSRLFGLRSVVRTVQAAGKMLVIAAAMLVVAWRHLDEVIRMGVNELGPALAGLGEIAFRCTLAGAVAVLLLSLLDLLFQRYQHARDLRMSRQEVKEEHRLTEGDPHLRARIRQLQREMATRRMMADVPKSTVVVTNPTHYAVALRYEPSDPARRAPVVVAKGADHLAQRIKEVAAAAGVVQYEDVELARALHARVEIGQEIPEELYAAVAVVLGYVLRLERSLAPA